MKKVYLLACVAFAGLSSFAQRTTEYYSFGVKQAKFNTEEANPHRPLPTSSHDDRALTIAWQEDFTGFTGLTTTNGTYTVSGPEGSYWTLDNVTTSPNGYDLTMNGDFLYWNSYDNVTESDFATTAVEGSIETPTIDLSGYSANIGLQFINNAMFCCNDEPWTVAVSIDNGTTYGTEIPLNTGLGSNDFLGDIADPWAFNTIISSYLDPTPANNDQVKLRFTWTGVDANGAGQYSTHYWWSVDDIMLYEIPPYEIEHKKMWLADVTTNYEYTDFPADQATTLTVASEIANNGQNEPSGLEMEVTVFEDDGTTVVDGPVSGGSLFYAPISQGEVDTLTFATSIDLSTYAVGTYMVRSVINFTETDEVLTNDTLWRTFNVTDDLYGHVNYDFNGVSNIVGYSETSRTGGRFTFNTATDIHGVDLYLLESGGTAATTTQELMAVYVDNLTTNVTVAAYDFLIPSSAFGDWHTFNFNITEGSESGPVSVNNTDVYAFTFETFGGDVLWYAASPVDADFSGAFYWGADGNWYWSGDEPWILLNSDVSLATEVNDDNAFNISQNVPNPFGNNSTISYSLDKAENVSVTFVDMTGKVVMNLNEGVKPAGKHKININGADFAEGTYFYTFTVGEEQVTKRMVVTK